MFALNYGCSYNRGIVSTPCVQNPAYAMITPDYTRLAVSASDDGVTTHDQGICLYQGETNTRMVTATLNDLVAANPDVNLPIEVSVVFALQVNPCDPSVDAVLTKIAEEFAKLYQVAASLVKATLLTACQATTSGRRRLNIQSSDVRVTVVAKDAAEAATLGAKAPVSQLALTTIMGPVTALYPTAIVLSAPKLQFSYVGGAYSPPIVVILPPAASSGSDSTGAIIGGVIGGLLVLALCIGGYFMYKKKQSKGYSQAAVVPA